MIALVCGCWDHLHVGHTNFLDRVVEECEHVIVVVMDDDWIRLTKGAEPEPYATRAKAIASRYPGAKVVSARYPDVSAYDGVIDIIYHGPDQYWIHLPTTPRVPLAEIPRTPGVSSSAIRSGVYIPSRIHTESEDVE